MKSKILVIAKRRCCRCWGSPFAEAYWIFPEHSRAIVFTNPFFAYLDNTIYMGLL